MRILLYLLFAFLVMAPVGAQICVASPDNKSMNSIGYGEIPLALEQHPDSPQHFFGRAPGYQVFLGPDLIEIIALAPSRAGPLRAEHQKMKGSPPIKAETARIKLNLRKRLISGVLPFSANVQ